MKTTTWINLYRYLGLYAKKDSSAWTEVWSGARPSTAPITAPGGRDLGDFRASGRAGDINNSINMPSYCDEPNGKLERYAKKDSSAWTEVWSGASPSRAPIYGSQGCLPI